MKSTTGEPITLTFAAFDMYSRYGCGDWVEIYDGTSIQRYCGSGSTPGPVTGTTITLKLHTSYEDTASGFLAVVTGDVAFTEPPPGRIHNMQ